MFTSTVVSLCIGLQHDGETFFLWMWIGKEGYSPTVIPHPRTWSFDTVSDIDTTSEIGIPTGHWEVVRRWVYSVRKEVAVDRKFRTEYPCWPWMCSASCRPRPGRGGVRNAAVEILGSCQSPALPRHKRQVRYSRACYKWPAVFLPSGRPTLAHYSLTVEIWPISRASVSPQSLLLIRSVLFNRI
jgi:hypothetical protein